MYGYSKKYNPIEIPEDFLEKIDQEKVFSLFIKEPIIVDGGLTKYKAPYREDNNPDCYFDYYNNELRFIDFASGDFHNSENCIGFVSKCTGLNFIESIYYILHITKNGILSLKTDTIKKNLTYTKPIVDDTIKYSIRQWNNYDKRFWFDQYKITKEQLILDKVFPITCYSGNNKITGKPYIIRTTDLSYVYSNFDNGKVKIYRPYNKDYKWFTNCNQNDIGNINNIPDREDQLVITKSYKDCRVLQNLGLTSIWFQNEGMLPSKKILEDLVQRYTKIIIWFDNDPTGQAAIKKVVEVFNKIKPNCCKGLFLPPKLLEENIKDPSDFISKKGQKPLLDFIKDKNL